jgi:ABC-type sugar transport system ATPase subunit
MALLVVTNLSKVERGNPAVVDVQFSQEKLQKIAIAGETGSGKTTLLKLIGGHAQADSGTVWFKGQKVKGLHEQLIPGHPGVAYLSQHFELPPHFWVHEILSYANQLDTSDAEQLYKICRVEHLLSRRTDQLSGGERQRIALARILSSNPELLLLDEPFSNLDAAHRSLIKSVLSDLEEKIGITCLIASHDGPDMLSWADQIMVMQKGRIIQQATPQEIYLRPVNSYCAGLFGEYNQCGPSSFLGQFTQGRKEIIIRPEQLQLVEKGTHHFQAIVEKILFFGNHYMINLRVAGETIQMNIPRIHSDNQETDTVPLNDNNGVIHLPRTGQQVFIRIQWPV